MNLFSQMRDSDARRQTDRTWMPVGDRLHLPNIRPTWLRETRVRFVLAGRPGAMPCSAFIVVSGDAERGIHSFCTLHSLS